MSRLIFIINILFLVSCNNSSEPLQNTADYFFDLNSYFSNEIKRLSNSDFKISKHIEFNDKKETEISSEINWKEELKIFQNIDINKAIWKDAYSADTISNNNGLVSKIKIEAKDSGLQTRLIDISYKNNKIETIEIITSKKNLISEMEYFLQYNPEKGFEIIKNEKMIFSKPLFIKIKSTFID